MWWTVLAIIAAVGVAFLIAPKGWRTIVVNVAVAIGAAAPALIDYLVGGSIDLATFLPSSLTIWLIPSLSVLNMVLRQITTTAIGKK